MLEQFRKSSIHDKHGEQYSIAAIELDPGKHKRFTIKNRGRRVGCATCHFEGEDVLFIDDLRTEDKAMRPPWFPINLLFWVGEFPPARWRVTNYQERGLGTAMLKFLSNYAKSESRTRIEGKVKRHDFKDNPDLVDWYRRRGFTVIMGDHNSALIAKISLTIKD